MKFKRILLAVIVVFGIIFSSKIIATKYIFPYKYKEVVDKYSNRYDINPLFVLSVIKAESNFNPDAKSNKSAFGLMQITESTGKDIAKKLEINNFSKEKLYDPETNIQMGVWYLNDLYKEFRDWNLVILAYNAGRGNVNKWLKNYDYSKDSRKIHKVPFKETEGYINKVNFYYKVYKKLYKEN